MVHPFFQRLGMMIVQMMSLFGHSFNHSTASNNMASNSTHLGMASVSSWWCQEGAFSKRKSLEADSCPLRFPIQHQQPRLSSVIIAFIFNPIDIRPSSPGRQLLLKGQRFQPTPNHLTRALVLLFATQLRLKSLFTIQLRLKSLLAIELRLKNLV